MSNTPIELKDSSFTLSVVHLHEVEPKVIHQALEDEIARAPAFLKHAPVVLNISALEALVSWSAIHKAASATGLRVTDVSGCKDAQLKAEIEEVGLPTLTEGKEKAPHPVPAPQAPAQNTTPVTKTHLIDTPVCSGQHICAPQCDLVVTGHVSARAELIADGNIHVYDMMRGRALAGASDDRETQIFCTSLMAEPMSIAGKYWLSDQIPVEFYDRAARLQLVENVLTVQPLN